MKYPHIAARLFNTPLLVAPDKARTILTALGPRFGIAPPVPGSSSPGIAAAVPGAVAASRKPYAVTDRGIAVISVAGTLVHRGAATVEPMSALTSYGDIEAEVMDAATDPAIRGILLDVDSHGGEANGCFDLADLIRQARDAKPIWAVADELALSAAYALASAASRLLVPRTGAVGSIGVLLMHLDVSASDRAEGLRYTTIFAGARKNDFSPHEPLSDEARAIAQAEVERVYDLFVETAARNRGAALTPAAARATDAAFFEGTDAVAAGLADAVAPFREALAELTESILRPRAAILTPSRAATAAPNPGHRKETIMNPTETAAAVPAATAASTPPKPATTGEVVDLAGARGAGYAEAQEIAELCQLAGRTDLAAGFIGEKKTAAEVRQALTAARAAATGGAVRTLVPAPGLSDESAIVAACKRLAAGHHRGGTRPTAA